MLQNVLMQSPSSSLHEKNFSQILQMLNLFSTSNIAILLVHYVIYDQISPQLVSIDIELLSNIDIRLIWKQCSECASRLVAAELSGDSLLTEGDVRILSAVTGYISPLWVPFASRDDSSYQREVTFTNVRHVLPTFNVLHCNRWKGKLRKKE